MKITEIISTVTHSVTSKVTRVSNQHKKKKFIFGIIPTPIKWLAGAILALIALILFVTMMMNNPNETKTTTPQVCSTDQSATDNANDTNVSGDWTKDGTSANKVAKQIWDYWNKKGYSAAAIAGVVGNVYAESGFNPVVAQGGGSILTDTPQGGGAGLYQFTPYTKFAAIGDSKWKDVTKQSDFVWSSEAHGFSGYSTITSVSDAAQKWFSLYERSDPSVAHMDKRTAAAEQAYKLWGSTASQTGSSSVIDQGSDTADENSSNSSATASNDCQTQDNTVDGSIAKLFDDKMKGLTLNAGLDDANHTGIGNTVGVHGPGAHDGWDMDPLGDPSGSTEPAIYAIAGGTIEGLGRGDDGGLLFVNIKLTNGNFLQYQEFKQGSIPDNLQKGQTIKAGAKIGQIGDAGSSGGIHFGRYVHITYSDKTTPVNGHGGIEQWGSSTHTLSVGELLGIKDNKWVNASKTYTWSDMTALKSAS